MKKIMFNDKYGLTQAVLVGRKTQTRRSMLKTARYNIGEEIAIAQKYSDITNAIPFTLKQELAQLPGWENKMFVKADLMPHRIRITNIRVERLQDISDEDCMAEGIVRFEKEYCYTCQNYAMTDFYSFSTPREAYAALIDKISGKDTWESNPWVFVYDFELVK